MWTKKEQEAVEFSFKAHKGQKRKGTGIDYIAHPMTVGIILAKLEADKEIIMAGVLHDIIEDTNYKKRDIEKRFGEKVSNLVKEVSEKDRDLPYIERKQRAAAKLLNVSEEAALIKAADVLANTMDLITDLEEKSDRAFKIFYCKKDEKIKQIERVVNILSLRLKKEEVINDLKDNLKKIKQYED